MVYRPTSVTVIGWLILVFGILGSLSIPMMFVIRSPAVAEAMAKNLMPIPIQYAIAIVGVGVQLVSGYFILCGKNWARLLYVIWSAFGLANGFFSTQMKIAMSPSIVIFFLIAFFLFRPDANAFFAGGGAIDPRSVPSTRRIIGVVFYVLAGFFLSCTGTTALMSAPDVPIKTLILCFQLFPFAVCLAIGKWLSTGSRWQIDVGVVFLIGAMAGAAFATMLHFMFASPEFQKRLTNPHQIAMDDYLFGVIWLGGWAVLGIALLIGGRKLDSDQVLRVDHK